MSEADANTSESASLSVEDAVAAMRAGPEPKQLDQAPAAVEQEDEEIEAGPTPAEDEREPAEADADVEAETPEPETVVRAPHWWSADQKARFAELPPDLQVIVAAQEGNRETAVSKAKQEAAEARKTADAAAKEYRERASRLDDLIPQAVQNYKDRWAQEPDWAAIAQEYGAEQAIIAQANYSKQKKAETEQLQGLMAAREQAEQDRFNNHVETETARLADLSPELSDPKEGPKRKAEVAKFLLGQGVSETQLEWITASELSIAYDAMRFRKMSAKTKADLGKPATPAANAAPAVRPSAAVSQTPRQRSIEQIQGRLSRTGSVEDGVALLRANRKLK